MKLIETKLAGAFLVHGFHFEDARGSFTKIYHEEVFAAHGISFSIQEQFYSVSAEGVLRGMHFQNPPHEHAKLVFCLTGRVLDVIVDLRRASDTYGKAVGHELTPDQPRALFVPVGFAHGFLALEDRSTLMYAVSSVHHPASDSGVLWDSFGFDWPTQTPLVSPRDQGFPRLEELRSLF